MAGLWQGVQVSLKFRRLGCRFRIQGLGFRIWGFKGFGV